ncbi:YcxB family protein [Erythrobacter sp. F6033]|uniref:YcxB family protein n=1 Tax=Erythrobacter sp. F6033 TaxID=2926401 RepID=UPI001FF34C57|nr:YcxB family protein [Erythrobacter sp. F6033]MCK0128228.1 YcxB family protein [Erythrobacter sp. F6033]
MVNRTTQFRIKEEHALAAANRVVSRKLKVPLLPVIFVASGAGLIGLMLGEGRLLGEWLPLLSWLLLTLALILASMKFWSIPRQARRLYRQSSLKDEMITLEWDEDGFSVEGKSAKSKVLWPHLFAWDEHDSVILLLQNELTYNIIPRTTFDDTQLADLRECLVKSGLKRL